MAPVAWILAALLGAPYTASRVDQGTQVCPAGINGAGSTAPTGCGITCADGSVYAQSGTTGGTCLTQASLAVGTAAALAANPTDCSAGQFATTIAANGNLTCAVPTMCLENWGGAQKVAVAGTGSGVAAFGLVWPGSTLCGSTAHEIKVNYYRSGGSDTCTVSLEDITNGNRICSVATTSTTVTNIVTCGSIGNVPSGAIILEVQSSSAGGTTCTVGGGYWHSR